MQKIISGAATPSSDFMGSLLHFHGPDAVSGSARHFGVFHMISRVQQNAGEQKVGRHPISIWWARKNEAFFGG